MICLVVSLIILSCILIVAEIFTSGFGVLGISGIVAFLASIILTAISPSLGLHFIFIEIVSFAAFCYLLYHLGKETDVYKKIVLKDSLNYDDSLKVDINLLHKEGQAISDLKPHGKIKIKGSTYDANSISGFIENGSAIKIADIKDNTIYVSVI
ncbi:MAG: NfeD family protein [Lachnospirales bacterium]